MHTKEFSRKCQYPVLFALGTVPVPLCLLGALAPGRALWSFLFFTLYLLFAWAAIVVPGKARKLVAAAGWICLLLPGILGPLVFLLPGICYGVLLTCSLGVGGWKWDDEISLQGHLLGLAVYAICFIAPLFMDSFGRQILSAASGSMELCLWVYSIFILLSMSRDSLFFAAKGKTKTSRGMHRKNMFFVAVFVALNTGLALLPALVNLLARAVELLFGVFLREPDDFIPLNPNAPTGSGGAAGDIPVWGAGENPEQTALLVKIGVALFLGAGLTVIVRRLLKKLPALKKWLSRFMASTTEEYTDEVTDLRSNEAKESTLGQRLREMARELRPGEQTPQKKIRRKYRLLRRSHRQWGQSATARETLPESAAAVYEKARYSHHEVTDEDYRDFKKATQKL